MNGFLRSLPPLVAVLVLAVGGVSGIGCAKKLPVGPVGAELAAYPAGRRDTLEKTPSDLIVWPDVALAVQDSSTDTLNFPPRAFTVYRSAPGVMHGLIVDYTQASGYQMFRQEDGGGFRSFSDFMLPAARRMPDRSYFGGAAGAVVLPAAQLFRFSDLAPPAIPLRGYVGRAAISGVTGSGYPLTNLGRSPDTTAIAPLAYTAPTGLPGPGAAPPDSLLDMTWETIPGAAAYWVHIYQKRADVRALEAADAIEIAHPSPIASGKVRDLFIGYFPAPRTSYKLGSAVPPGCRVLAYRTLIGLQEVLIRVSAVDANGRLIATTGSAGDRDIVAERIGEVDRRRSFLLGAKRVTPGRPPPPE